MADKNRTGYHYKKFVDDFNDQIAAINKLPSKTDMAKRSSVCQKKIYQFDKKKPAFIKPGMLTAFMYKEPKLKEELKYYDARPMVLVFNVFKSGEGQRILGFNIHYYPEKFRMLILKKIFQIYNEYFLANAIQERRVSAKRGKTIPFTNLERGKTNGFEYPMLMKLLQQYGLDFGIREYIPELMANVSPVNTSNYGYAAYTEGNFKKETLSAIIRQFNNAMKK